MRERSRGTGQEEQGKACRNKQHVKIDNMKEMSNLICGRFAVGGNYNSTRDNKAYPYYLVTMVFHDQSNDISANIKVLEEHVSNWGYPNHAIHTAPLIRRESVYENELRENRKALFNALFSNVEFRKSIPKDYKLSQTADLICTLEEIHLKDVFTKSEVEFFHSKNAFNKNIYKNIVKKKL